METLFKVLKIQPLAKVYKPRSKITPFNNRRYKLHQKVKNICDLRAKQILIVVHYQYQIENKYIIELQQKFEYNIQAELFDSNEIEVLDPKVVTN